MQLTILIPCLNESKTIVSCIEKAFQFISSRNLEAEVLVADNCSADNSVDLAKKAGARVISVENRGYGSALSAGCRQAAGRYIIMGDADGSYDLSKLDDFLIKLEAGYEVVVGNRFRGQIESQAMPWKNRYIGNPILSLVGRFFFKSSIGDFHCGLRAITKDAFLLLDLRTNGMEFASEMIIKASLRNLRITEIPINFYKDGRSSKPHLRPWRDGFRHLKFMFLLCPRWLFFYPGLLLAAISLCLFFRLTHSTIEMFSVTLDIHSLILSVCGLVLGLQSVSFAIISNNLAEKIDLNTPSYIIEKVSSIFESDFSYLFSFLLCCLGIVCSINAFQLWGQLGFGNIEGRALYPYVFGALVSFILAGQSFLTTCFCQMLNFLIEPQR